MSVARCCMSHFQLLPSEQRGQNKFRNVFRQWRDRGEDQRRWTTEKHGYRQRLIQTFGFAVMKTATFLDLPVQAGRVRVVYLHAIDAKVVFLSDWVLGVDKRQRNEGAPVLLPGRQNWKFVEMRRSVDDLRYGRTAGVGRAQLQEIQRDGAMFPQFGGTWRQYRLGDMNKLTDHRLWLWTKREIDSTISTKKVGDDRITASLDAREQQRWPTLSNHTTMDLRKLKGRIYLRFDCNNLIFSSE